MTNQNVTTAETGKLLLQEIKKIIPGHKPFEFWRKSLSKKDKLPRGKWFHGKVAGPIPVFLDEFSTYYSRANRYPEK